MRLLRISEWRISGRVRSGGAMRRDAVWASMSTHACTEYRCASALQQVDVERSKGRGERLAGTTGRRSREALNRRAAQTQDSEILRSKILILRFRFLSRPA